MAAAVKKEIEKLRDTIRAHDHKYYVLAKPSISDLEYDKLLKTLQRLEEQNPDLVTPDFRFRLGAECRAVLS